MLSRIQSSVQAEQAVALQFLAKSPIRHFLLDRAVLICMVGMLIGLLPSLCHAQSTQQPPNAERPILFVHGWCGESDGWKSMRTVIAKDLGQQFVTQYPNINNYDAYYDGNSVVFIRTADGTQMDESTVPADARFFSIKFYDPTGVTYGLFGTTINHFDGRYVAEISILNKADELAHVIGAIARITKIKDLIVVAHSMGGLVARAYIEDLAIRSLAHCTDVDHYSSCLGEQRTRYTQDISRIITIDTPHSGDVLADFINPLINSGLDCCSKDTLNRRELEEPKSTLQVVSMINSSVVSAPADPAITAIQSYTSPDILPIPTLWGGMTGDGIVTFAEQGINKIAPTRTNYSDVPNFFGNASDFYKLFFLTAPLSPLHTLTVDQPQTQTIVENEILKTFHTPPQTTSVSITATLDGASQLSGVSYEIHGPSGLVVGGITDAITPSTSYDLPVGFYSVVYKGGGPGTTPQVSPWIGQYVGVNSDTGESYWAIAFTINFKSVQTASPTAITQNVTGVAGDGATLGGSVNPNGSPTMAWFEWGTSSSLATFSSTSSVPIGSGTSAQTVTFNLNGLPSNATYYYRVAASSDAAAIRSTSILSFTTLGTLPKPTLQSPSNGATGVSTTASFSWTAVQNATSYRLIVATNPGALPTDATSAVCGAGCILNVTPTSAAFLLPSGTLTPGTTYYWEVHARSPSQFGDWSAIFSFTAGTPAVSDFSLLVTPSSQSVVPSASVTYNVTTATTSGSPQSIILSVGNPPAGVIAAFSPATVVTGSSSTLTITTSSTASVGTYVLPIVASGTAVSHAASIGLSIVSSATGNPQLTASPSIFTFPQQTVNTASAPLVISLVNSGSAALTITSLSAPAGFVPSFLNGLGLPITLQPGGYANMQVVFIPTTTGLQQGSLKLFNTTSASPFIITLAGTGVVAPVTTGNIQVSATFNGQPWSGTVAYTLTGPQSYNGGSAPNTYYNMAPGSYSLSYTVAGPGGATFVGITPSTTQNLSAGNTITFTLNFAGSNTFGLGGPQPASTVLGVGNSAQFQLPQLCVITGSTQIINLTAAGGPPGASVTFSPNPIIIGCGVPEVLTVSTSPSTPPGIYSIVVTGTNQDGFSPSMLNITLTLDKPPVAPTQLVSLSGSGTQGNGISGASFSNMRVNAISASGQYVAFVSSADNLVSNDTNGQPDIFVRDTRALTTTRVSVATDGTQTDFNSFDPSISADGRYVAFGSMADNLYPGSVLGTPGIYVRDLQNGTTTRIDLAPNGVPANATSISATLSSDGRFVGFWSSASNLLPSAPNGGTFVFDTKTKKMLLASVASDGTPGNSQGSSTPQISADGRFVAFTSSSTNLVPGDTNGRPDVFVHDFQTQVTVRVNVANDGTQDDCGVISTVAKSIALSADGRYVQFLSCGHTLVPGVTNPNTSFATYIRDMNTGQVSLLSATATGDVVNVGNVGNLSADSRFAVFDSYLEDRTIGSSTLLSVAADGSNGNGTSGPASISADGSTIVFSSNSTNLVSSDVNGVTDVFSIVNPFLNSAPVNSLTLSSSSAPGGSTVTGTLALNGVAPAGGATIVVSSNNSAAQVPALALIPPGATTGTFSFNTAIVPNETVLTIVASYNGGAAVALLTLEPAPALSVAPSALDFGNQPVNTTSTVTALSISNIGTATLTLNSVTLSTGQVFGIGTDTCGASLAPGNTCSVSLTFSPKAPGLVSDSLQINFGTPASVQSVSLSGNGAIPSVSLFPGTINFGNQVLQGTALAIATVTNTGNAPLMNIGASVTGANATDFAVSSDNCSGASLLVNNSCLITLNFSPKATGTRSATLSLSDNASGSPQTVSLTGIATDFSIGAATGGPLSATVTAGQSAAYNLAISPTNGFAGTVTLSCSGAPAQASCTINPPTLNVNGTAAPFTVNVATTARSSSLLPLIVRFRSRPMNLVPLCSAALGLLIALAAVAFLSRVRRWRPAALFLGMILLSSSLASCGGGANSLPPPVQTGTPAGSYTITVTGTSGGVNRNQTLTLTVQ